MRRQAWVQQQRWLVSTGHFSHIDEHDRSKPAMVDVSSKGETRRRASAEATLWIERSLTKREENDLIDIVKNLEKVVQAAAINGALQTSRVIPFCHPLSPLSVEAAVHLDYITRRQLTISVEATTSGKTGVEMEALSGAAWAALTTAPLLPQPTNVGLIRLTHKSGGKSGSVDYDVAGNAVV
ncbi:Cyclic pyranopterin monophosphate synthase accessory protein [Diplonema papillatum]|nr:Cyclic pyranopterin monophosphate synthase accessory protein [Diplonema papillatum]